MNFGKQRKSDFDKDLLAKHHGVPLIRIAPTRTTVEQNKHCFIRQDLETFQRMIAEGRGGEIYYPDAAPYIAREIKYGKYDG